MLTAKGLEVAATHPQWLAVFKATGRPAPALDPF
jgi:hypothetical protein